MSSSNCCFLTCIQISQEADQVVWYSHLFQNFPPFCLWAHLCLSTHTVLVFLWINTLFHYFPSLVIFSRKAEGPGPCPWRLSWWPGFSSLIAMTSISGWERKPCSSCCRPRPLRISFGSQEWSWVVVTETAWTANPEIVTIFTEKVWWPLFYHTMDDDDVTQKYEIGTVFIKNSKLSTFSHFILMIACVKSDCSFWCLTADLFWSHLPFLLFGLP